MERVTHEFEPVFDDHSKILILGTLPSVKSREQRFFYGHPQNRFWKVIAAVTGHETPVTVEEKKLLLLSSHIAVWDVIASCDIEGSSDSSIRNVIPADLGRILDAAPIKAVYANGAAAYRLYEKYCRDKTGREAVKLPSTSPANAAWSLERLIASWSVCRMPLGLADAADGIFVPEAADSAAPDEANGVFVPKETQGPSKGREYRTVLFDFDYTLANSEKPIVACFRHVFEREGIDNITDQEIRQTIGLTLEEAFSGLTGLTDGRKLQEFRQIFVEKSDQVMVEETVLFWPVIPLFSVLKRKGIMTGIISTKYRYRIEGTLSKYGIRGLVDIVVGGEDVKRAKPEPEGIELALRKLGAAPSDTLYVGDSLVDAKTARAAGVAFAAVTTGTTPASEFEAFSPVGIYRDLEALRSLFRG